MSRPAARSAINVSAMTRRYDVDQLIPLRNYYRIADNLLRQANIYREEENIIDLYIMLLRYSSLVSETIPYHHDYPVLYPKERTFYRKKLLSVMTELEALKPQVQQQLEAIKQAETADQNSSVSTSNGLALGYTNEKLPQASTASTAMIAQPSWKQYDDNNRVSSSNSLDSQLHKLSLGLPLPRQETLSRHSLLGPSGLRGQWQGPTSGIKVNYPTNAEPVSNEIPSLNQVSTSQVSSEMENHAMASVLSLDDGRWPSIDQDSDFPLIRQPSPPPVLAQVKPEYRPLSPSKVADPRPGPANSLPDATPGSNSFKHLHIPMKMLDEFLRLAQKNTARNVETCGHLTGFLKNRVFYISALIVPKQKGTSDSCETLNEEEIIECQTKNAVFSLGWIHTHPTQTCFMSSIDLHTQYSYQIMMPESISIVMAPSDKSCPHGIFTLSEPSGVSVIRNCQQRGFHPHEEPDDGSPIYEHTSHVFINPNLEFKVVDLR